MAEDLRGAKATLRTVFLAQRRSLSPRQVSTWSEQAISRLRSLPEFTGARAYLVYLASKDNELDTLPFVEDLIREGRVVLVPVGGKERTLVWSRIESLAEATPSTFGILEPRSECIRPVEPPAGSLAVVPGIVFTRDGGRIGYGAGYYDRFLAGFEGVKIGLAYEAQLAAAIPMEPHDVPLDIVVTEVAVYRCP